ncbi:MAG: thioesterase family protein [Bdellovibrionota bacterium]|nr:hypothetical protein [Pseudobdellovibrionaceae bacterium]|tara:strand:- start:9221 stop:9628 length:408 start_codon:yes stop_codon:yes gene_type:complete
MNDKLYTQKHMLHFSHCDPAGIIFYSRVYELHHIAYENWVGKVYSWEDWFRHKTYAFPIVHSEADYSAPMRAGQEIEIVLRKKKLSQNSYQLESSIYLGDKICAKASSIHVCVSKAGFQKAPIPDFVKECLEKTL